MSAGFPEDTNVTFISCHLASDKDGKSKVEKRNKDSNDVVEELGLDHTHHVVLAGDLNYRMNLEPGDVLATLIQAQGWWSPHTEKNIFACIYTILSFSPFVVFVFCELNSQKHIVNFVVVNVYTNPGRGDIAKWGYFHESDQLIHEMAVGNAFKGFREVALPRFPPTYRRERNVPHGKKIISTLPYQDSKSYHQNLQFPLRIIFLFSQSWTDK